MKKKPEIAITGLSFDSAAIQGSQLNSALKRFAVGLKTYRSVETVDPERPVKKNEWIMGFDQVMCSPGQFR